MSCHLCFCETNREPEVTFQGWHSLYAPQQLLMACICMACRDPEESPGTVAGYAVRSYSCTRKHIAVEHYIGSCYRKLSYLSICGNMCTTQVTASYQAVLKSRMRVTSLPVFFANNLGGWDVSV